MNAILINSRQIPFYTDLKLVFESINNIQSEYNWLLTGLELNWIPDDLLEYVKQNLAFEENGYGNTKLWMTGEQLTRLVHRYEIQFIWGMLMGFEKSEAVDVGALAMQFYSNAYEGWWQLESTMQHPKAKIEIICWDSTLTLFLSKDQTVVESFKAYFKDAKDLDEYNFEASNRVKKRRE